jgi:hypothetical protein
MLFGSVGNLNLVSLTKLLDKLMELLTHLALPNILQIIFLEYLVMPLAWNLTGFDVFTMRRGRTIVGDQSLRIV